MWIKVWGWLKRNWRWVLFPIGVLLFVASLLGRRSDPIDEGTDKRVDEAIDEIEEANRTRDQRLEELKAENMIRLKDLSNDQQKELDELRQKPIEEVTAWFDALR